MFKRLEELEEENDILRSKIRDLHFILGSINQKSTEYLQKNCSISHVGLNRIKELAEGGLDLIMRKEN